MEEINDAIEKATLLYKQYKVLNEGYNELLEANKRDGMQKALISMLDKNSELTDHLKKFNIRKCECKKYFHFTEESQVRCDEDCKNDIEGMHMFSRFNY